MKINKMIVLMAIMLSIIVPAYAQDLIIPPLPPRYGTIEVHCLAKAIYYESKTEHIDGRKAVAFVVLNRVLHPEFPKTICGVIYEGPKWNGIPIRNRCQFSFYCNGVMSRAMNKEQWNASLDLAEEIANGTTQDITMGALFFHAVYVSPGWRYRKLTTIGNHIFYTKD